MVAKNFEVFLYWQGECEKNFVGDWNIFSKEVGDRASDNLFLSGLQDFVDKEGESIRSLTVSPDQNRLNVSVTKDNGEEMGSCIIVKENDKKLDDEKEYDKLLNFFSDMEPHPQRDQSTQTYSELRPSFMPMCNPFGYIHLRQGTPFYASQQPTPYGDIRQLSQDQLIPVVWKPSSSPKTPPVTIRKNSQSSLILGSGFGSRAIKISTPKSAIKDMYPNPSPVHEQSLEHKSETQILPPPLSSYSIKIDDLEYQTYDEKSFFEVVMHHKVVGFIKECDPQNESVEICKVDSRSLKVDISNRGYEIFDLGEHTAQFIKSKIENKIQTKSREPGCSVM